MFSNISGEQISQLCSQYSTKEHFESLTELLEEVGPTAQLTDIQRAEFNRLYRELQNIIKIDSEIKGRVQ